MNVLFVTPYKGEMPPGILEQHIEMIEKVRASIMKQDSTVEAHILPLYKLDLANASLSEIKALIEANRAGIDKADVIHSFSEIPLLFRSHFKNTLVMTLHSDEERLRLFDVLPRPTEPGYEILVRPELINSEITADDVLYFYRYVINNKKQSDIRPWGFWESLELSKHYKVKHIYIGEGQKLSLQKHQHRTEVWIVVEGSGTISVDEKIFQAKRGDVFVVNKEKKHRASGGAGGLHFIEVQYGDYLGEDDIIRLEDIYGRL